MKALTLLAAALALAACGRVGPVRSPGPADAIIYPRAYPHFPPGTHPGDPPVTPRPADSLTPGAPPAETPLESGDPPIARPGSPR
ncbi:hypothetical protein SAMN02745194_03910 [Roseomonas rosea]|uniref:Lipoprotein-attachment site-containing protein n=1 Tax=Muricoccus roseus TaxID=198092 RepID=A0A1M6NU26_9PROT|nr:hypothetical protein [Roseomonas rosea]SHJ99180.1 hypothetical protein SAMN02745194_03910 [Roseomonas rosea]